MYLVITTKSWVTIMKTRFLRVQVKLLEKSWCFFGLEYTWTMYRCVCEWKYVLGSLIISQTWDCHLYPKFWFFHRDIQAHVPYSFCLWYIWLALSGFKKEDKLSLLHQGRFRGFKKQAADIEIRVTNNVKDRVVSWTKLFAVSRPDLPELCIFSCCPFPVHFIDKNNRINVICSERLLSDRVKHGFVNVYVIGKDGLKKQEIERYVTDKGWSIKAGYTYLPSLVPVT